MTGIIAEASRITGLDPETGKQMTAGQSFMTMVVTGTPNRRSA